MADKEIKVTIRNTFTKDGIRSIEPIDLNIVISEPNGEIPKHLTKEDVWGIWDNTTYEKIDKGMVVASTNEKCPIFGDIVPFKSVTVVGPKKYEDEIIYWLEFVHGCDSVAETKDIDDLKVAIRSDYQCW